MNSARTIDFSQHKNLQSLIELDENIQEFVNAWQSGTSQFHVKTSGSTGIPKEIRVSRKQMEISAQKTAVFLNLKKGNTCLICLSGNTIAGKMMLVRAMEVGMIATIITPSAQPFEGFDKGFDFVALVPLQVENALDSISFQQSKNIIIGGAPLSSTLEHQLASLENNIYQTYGMTETVSHIALKKVGTKYYKTLPDVSITTDDRQCLVIDAPMATESPIITNDIVSIIDDTTFQWVGRHDFVINSGGIKIHAESLEKEIEALLIKQNINCKALVFGLPDTKYGESINVVLEGASLDDNKKAMLQKALPQYHFPKLFFRLDHFVYKESGKLDRLSTIALTHPY